MNSDANGEFVFNAVPLGEYAVSVSGTGFEQTQQDVLVAWGSQPVLHFVLNVAGTKETVNVTASPGGVLTDSHTPTTVVDGEVSSRTPGAARANSMAMVSVYVRG